jgi:hypothetical protein
MVYQVGRWPEAHDLGLMSPAEKQGKRWAQKMGMGLLGKWRRETYGEVCSGAGDMGGGKRGRWQSTELGWQPGPGRPTFGTQVVVTRDC